MSEQIHTVHAEELGQFCAALFMTEGVPEDEARITADVLVEANLAGMDSHGVSRVAAYMERLRQGGNRRVARVDVLADFPAGATWDANGSLGQVVAYRAMRAAMDETARRRQIQDAYNKAHGIVPKTIVKSIRDLIEISASPTPEHKGKGGVKMTRQELAREIEKLEAQMRKAAHMMEYEYAAVLRDEIIRLRTEADKKS